MAFKMKGSPMQRNFPGVFKKEKEEEVGGVDLSLIEGAKAAAGTYDDAQGKALSDISSTIHDAATKKEEVTEEEEDDDEEGMGYVGPEITLVG